MPILLWRQGRRALPLTRSGLQQGQGMLQLRAEKRQQGWMQSTAQWQTPNDRRQQLQGAQRNEHYKGEKNGEQDYAYVDP